MTKILFYDTETTGLPIWSTPSGDPGQPHIVQLAASLVDADTRSILASVDLVAQPAGWEIDSDAFDLHGISVEYAARVGIEEMAIIDVFLQLWNVADFRVAHNESFDARILRIACMRFYSDDETLAENWKVAPAECTQKQARPIVKAPPTDKMKAKGNHGIKAPTLLESYMHFFGPPFEGQHTARGDMMACRAVYFAIQDLVAS